MDEKIIYAVGGAVAGILAGAGGVYLFMQKRFEIELQESLDKELAATKKFYAAINKPSPEDMVREHGLTFEAQMAEGRALIVDLEYGGEEEEAAAVAEELTEVAKNVFTDYANTSTWDADAEEAKRDPNKPYVISFEEFFENEPDYIQTQLTWFSEDSVLADQDDKPVDEAIVGEENLQKFGHGSKDPNIVYIRNETMDLDFEISFAEGKYSEQVMGFGVIQHEASPRRAIRKFRLDDD